MRHFLKLAVLGFVYTASAFDLEDYATTYRATRDAYLKAANELKLATGPYKAARDAYVAATATYTKSLYERRRLGSMYPVTDYVNGVSGLAYGEMSISLPIRQLSCFFPRREPVTDNWLGGSTQPVAEPAAWQKHNHGVYANRFNNNRLLCTADILSSKSGQCFPEPVDLNVIDDPEMCHGVEKALRTAMCRLMDNVKLLSPQDYRSIVNAAGAGAVTALKQDINNMRGIPPDRRLEEGGGWMWKVHTCRQDNFHNNPGVTSRDQFAYKIPGEESCLGRIKMAQEVNSRIARAIVDKRIANVKRGASPCVDEMEALENVLVEVKRADLELRHKVSAVLSQQLEPADRHSHMGGGVESVDTGRPYISDNNYIGGYGVEGNSMRADQY